MSDEEMDSPKVLEALEEVLRQQGASILTLTLLAGSLRGLGGAAVKPSLRSFVLAELEDTYLLAEKMSALGGCPRFDVAAVEVPTEPDRAMTQLLEHEREAIAALHAVIPHSGQEPRSEALEHLLEHVIMRKQQQIDFLWHATQSA
ncbi:MAG: ferritin-like domain-containing protein [Nocardioidaceae bacterium]